MENYGQLKNVIYVYFKNQIYNHIDINHINYRNKELNELKIT